MSDTCHVRIGALDLAEADAFGVQWRASSEEFTGWDGSPGSSAESSQRPADHGAWSSTPYLQPRAIAVGGIVRAPNHGALHAAFRRLNEAVSLVPTTLRVAEDGGLVRTALVRRSGQVMTKPVTSKTGEWSISVVADDPLLYGETERSATAFLPNVSGGWSPPMTFPFHIGAVVTTNQVAIFNSGDQDARPVLQIHGPVVDPVVLCPDTGAEMRFRISLAAGDDLRVDCARGSVVLNNSVTRRHTLLGSSFLAFPPGSSSVLYAGGSYDPASFLRLTWKDTWG